MHVDQKRIEAATKLLQKGMAARHVAARCLMTENDVLELKAAMLDDEKETPTLSSLAPVPSGTCTCGAPTYDGKEWCWRHEMNPHRRPEKPEAAPVTTKCRGCERKAEKNGWCPGCHQKLSMINSRQGNDTIRAARIAARQIYW